MKEKLQDKSGIEQEIATFLLAREQKNVKQKAIKYRFECLQSATGEIQVAKIKLQMLQEKKGAIKKEKKIHNRTGSAGKIWFEKNYDANDKGRKKEAVIYQATTRRKTIICTKLEIHGREKP